MLPPCHACPVFSHLLSLAHPVHARRQFSRGPCHPLDTCSAYANTLMPHVRLETSSATPVPEPTTVALLSSGVVAFIAHRRRGKNSQ